MTSVHALMVLIIRLWAASAIISSITTLSYYLPFDKSSAENATAFYVINNIVQTGIWLALAIVAWIFSPKIARLVYAKKDDEAVSINVDADTLVMIGSFLIGFFYLVEYVPQLFVQAATMVVELAKDDPTKPYSLGTIRSNPFALQDLVGELLIVLVAFWMAFRPSHIAHMFSNLRRAGLAKVKEELPEK